MAESRAGSAAHTGDDRRRATGSEKLVALVGLVGALLGALGGFGGSLLIYNQGARAQDTVANQRLADIRRSAYSDFVAQTQSLRQAVIDFHNGVVLRKTGDALVEISHNTVEPEGVKYARAVTSVILVASDPVRKAADEVGTARDQLGALISASITFTPQGNLEYPYNASDFQVRLDNYDKKVRAFVQAAKAEVI